MPGALVAWARHAAPQSWPQDDAVRVILLGVLAVIAYAALRDHSGFERAGAAAAVAVWALLTNGLIMWLVNGMIAQ